MFGLATNGRLRSEVDFLASKLDRANEKLGRIHGAQDRSTLALLAGYSEETRDEICLLDYGRTWDEQIEWMRVYGEQVTKALEDAGHAPSLLEFSPQMVAAALILGVKPDAEELARAKEARRKAHLEQLGMEWPPREADAP